GGGGRAADSGITMHHHWRGAVPFTDEIDQAFYVLLGRHGVTVHRRGDVVDGKYQVVLGCDLTRPLDAVAQPQKRDDMARPGFIDRGVETREGTDVNHGRSGSNC